MHQDSVSALNLEIRNMLGSGSFAQVYQCFDQKDNQTYAVKMISKQSLGSSKMKYFAKEAKILSEINHKNIVNFHSFHETEQCLLIKMSIIKGGTLKKLIQQRKTSRRPFNQLQISIFLKNLLEGVKYLHALNIIHRDLKPGKYHHNKIENILFDDSNDLSTVKIVDFGLSAKLQMNNPTNLKSQCGTLLYMAPQIFYKPSYTKSVDIWSISVITYMLFNEGNHPFFTPGMKVEDFKNKIKNQNYPLISDKLAQNFIEKISKKQYQQRYNVNEALKHPFITRNKQDQIPLSIHQSFKGFDSIKEILSVMKLNITINKLIQAERIKISEEYHIKVKGFTQINQKNRVTSPSRKKMKDRHNQFFNKMKQILNNNNNFLDSSQQYIPKNDYKQQQSPTLKKHQSFFMSLFEKQKTIQLDQSKNSSKFINSSAINLKKVDNNASFFNSFSDFQQKQEVQQTITAKSEKIIMQQKNYKNNQIKNLSKTVQFNNSYQDKYQLQQQKSFKAVKLDLIKEIPDQKRKIFQKKSLVEDKESKIKYNPRFVKKYSFINQKQKQESAFKNNHKFSLSTKINNKKNSPGKQLSKPLFNNFPKYMNYTQKK